MFFKYPGNKGDLYKFCPNLEKIGSEFDTQIQNGTYVDIISDPVEAWHPHAGVLSVIKIRADISVDYHTIFKEFWVPVDSVHFVNYYW